jgi:multimeric flavodoxin WrbA
MKNFIDLQGGLWAQGKLINKVVSAISSTQNPHGGQEATCNFRATPFLDYNFSRSPYYEGINTSLSVINIVICDLL